MLPLPALPLLLQGIASSPLWDGAAGAVVGVISASDFIHTLRRLRSAVSSGHNPLSEVEMDAHTVSLPNISFNTTTAVLTPDLKLTCRSANEQNTAAALHSITIGVA